MMANGTARTAERKIAPARPRAPDSAPRLSAALLRPRLLANLIASFPDYWYESDFCEFRVGRSSGTVVNEPEAIRHILVSRVENYPKDDNQLAILKPLLGEGLLTSEGEIWRRNRKRAAPLFQHSSIADFAPLFASAARRSVDRVLRSGQPFFIDREMTRLTLEIIGESILGSDLTTDIEGISDTVTRVLDKFPAMFLAGTLLPTRLRNGVIERLELSGRKRLDIFARKIIKTAEGSNRDDTLLARLMNAAREDIGREMTLGEVRDEVATFLLAGHETTATTLSWAWYLLTLHPDALTEIQREVDAIAGDRPVGAEDVAALRYTRAVIDESLRLYPVVSNIMRRAREADTLPGGIEVSPGRRLLISPWIVHRHRRYWRNPDGFEPTRFLGDETKNLPRYAYLPFGGGPRICIGASFALLEAVLILATFAQRADIRVVNAGQVMPQARIVLRPDVRLHAVAARRERGVRR